MTDVDKMKLRKVSGGGRFPLLTSTVQIGSLKIRNRILVTAMGVNLANADGTVSDRLIDYHVEHARGGAGLIVMGVCGVAWPIGAVQPYQIAISDDCFIPGLRRVTDAVHAAGGRIAAQLHHGGLIGAHLSRGRHPLWAPDQPPPFTGDMPEYFLPEERAAPAEAKTPVLKLLDKKDIAHVVQQFVDGALRAKAAGFDGAEIHGGHGYLLSSFISPSTNQRTDEYGGSLQNRARLLLEVVRAVRAAVGADFPLWVKIDAYEIGKSLGITLEDACQVAPWVEAEGADAITVSAYHNVGWGKLHSASNIPHEPGAHIDAARAIKAGLRIPVIASGRIELDVGEASIAAGDFDILAMGRKLLADPFLPEKLMQRRADDIRPCIYCYTCVSTAYVRVPVRCAVRPETAFEGQSWAPGAGRRRVVVVGGGPGGMEAARRLDAAGDEVVLLERGSRLGGTLQFAGLAYEPNERLLNWLRRQIDNSNIDVRLRTEATAELVTSLKPDVVLVATGAVREMPHIPGSEHNHVLSGDDMRKLMLGERSDALRRKTGLATRLAIKLGGMIGATANLEFVRRATHAWMPLGERIVIIGGELVGLELAEFLVERGRKVAVVGEAPKFGAGLLVVRRMRLIPELKEHGVGMFPGASEIRIDSSAVRFTNATGTEQSLPADHVIVAAGARGDTTIADQLQAAGLKVHAFGDCTGVSYIEGAIRGAAETVAGL